MDKKTLPVVIAATLACEAALSDHHHAALGAQPHTEIDIKVPAATKISTVSASGAGGAAPLPTALVIKQVTMGSATGEMFDIIEYETGGPVFLMPQGRSAVAEGRS
jgi:hypothetical protein